MAGRARNTLRRAVHKLRCRACRVLKQDIPEVEAVITALIPRLEAWWVEAIENTLRRGDLLLGIEEITAAPLPDIQALVGRTQDGRTREQIEAELTSLLVRQIEDAVSSLPAELAQIAEESRDTLLLDASLALGLSLETSQMEALERRLGPLRAGVVADLETLMAGRVLTRRPEIRQTVQRLARSRVRAATGLGTGTPVATTQSLRDELRALLGATAPRQWISFVADQWGYRWFNIGQFLSSREEGFTLFEAFNNPPRGPDEKTTPFCRSIHRRVVDVASAENQIRRHVRAALAGDIDGLMENWPLLPSELVNDRSPGAQARHQFAFARVGLPPYHARCRTVVRPIRLSR